MFGWPKSFTFLSMVLLLGHAGVLADSDPEPGPFTWLSLPAMFTCEIADVYWLYSGDDNMTIAVTDFSVAQLPPPSETIFPNGTLATANMVRRADVIFQISGSMPASTGFFSWSPVNVSSGWYVLIADFLGAWEASDAFFVGHGSNASCLAATTTNPPMAEGAPFPSTTASSSASSTPTGPSFTRLGGIIGGIIGCFAASVLVAGLMLRCAGRRQGGRFPWPAFGIFQLERQIQALQRAGSNASSLRTRIPPNRCDPNLIEPEGSGRVAISGRGAASSQDNQLAAAELGLSQNLSATPHHGTATISSSASSYPTILSLSPGVSPPLSPAYPSGTSLYLLSDPQSVLDAHWSANNHRLSTVPERR
uniref:Uncharacterized protein n=1 Tax=Mycena chlorophos TaxID=658473 RepID=A0ABQ0LCH6_MYCCL|nr:predicted protein [Mycena chlorophos]